MTLSPLCLLICGRHAKIVEGEHLYIEGICTGTELRPGEKQERVIVTTFDDEGLPSQDFSVKLESVRFER